MADITVICDLPKSYRCRMAASQYFAVQSQRTAVRLAACGHPASCHRSGPLTLKVGGGGGSEDHAALLPAPAPQDVQGRKREPTPCLLCWSGVWTCRMKRSRSAAAGTDVTAMIRMTLETGGGVGDSKGWRAFARLSAGSMSRTNVIGLSGHIGAYLILALAEQGHRVVSAGAKPASTASLDPAIRGTVHDRPDGRRAIGKARLMHGRAPPRHGGFRSGRTSIPASAEHSADVDQGRLASRCQALQLASAKRPLPTQLSRSRRRRWPTTKSSRGLRPCGTLQE